MSREAQECEYIKNKARNWTSHSNKEKKDIYHAQMFSNRSADEAGEELIL